MKTLRESLLDDEDAIIGTANDAILIHQAQQWICDNVRAFSNTKVGADAVWDHYFSFTVNGSVVRIEPRTVNGAFRDIFFSKECEGVPDWIDFDFSAVENIAFLGDNFKNYDVLNKTFSGRSIKWCQGSKAPVENLDIRVQFEVEFFNKLPKFKNCNITFNFPTGFCLVGADNIDNNGFNGIVFKRINHHFPDSSIILNILGTKLSRYISKQVHDIYDSLKSGSAKEFTDIIDNIPGVGESDFGGIIYTKSKKLIKDILDNKGSHLWTCGYLR